MWATNIYLPITPMEILTLRLSTFSTVTFLIYPSVFLDPISTSISQHVMNNNGTSPLM